VADSWTMAGLFSYFGDWPSGPLSVPPAASASLERKNISASSVDRHISTLQKSPVHRTGANRTRRRRHATARPSAARSFSREITPIAPSPRRSNSLYPAAPDRDPRAAGCFVGQVSSSDPMCFLLNPCRQRDVPWESNTRIPLTRA
jgi:hypothetical protein